MRRNARGARTYAIRELLPEEDAAMSIRLFPGRYTLWCTVGDHRARGMRATVTVTK